MKTPEILTTLAFTAVLFACNNERKSAETAAEAIEPPPVTAEGLSNTFGGSTPADSLFFSLERTPCFGTCKAYRVSVYRSGYATYDGRGNVEKLGQHTGFVTEGMMKLLLARTEEAGFFDMQDKYDADVTDIPSTIMRMAANGRDKKVIGRVGQPAAFKALAAFAEEQLLGVRWKAVQSEP